MAADPYAKRPKVQRFNQKETYGARTVKRTVVTRRTHPALAGRPERKMIPMKKGR